MCHWSPPGAPWTELSLENRHQRHQRHHRSWNPTKPRRVSPLATTRPRNPFNLVQGQTCCNCGHSFQQIMNWPFLHNCNILGLLQGWKLCRMQIIISSDRSSYSVNVLLYIRSRFLRLRAFMPICIGAIAAIAVKTRYWQSQSNVSNVSNVFNVSCWSQFVFNISNKALTKRLVTGYMEY